MNWLNVPHIQQSNTAWCLPACVAMVSAFLQQPVLQDDAARWLRIRGVGTVSSRIVRLNHHGFNGFYGTGSLTRLESWLAQPLPAILFVRTGDLLPFWQVDTPMRWSLLGLRVSKSFCSIRACQLPQRLFRLGFSCWPGRILIIRMRY
jgi:hypothetical protein